MFKTTLGFVARNIIGVLIATMMVGCSGNSPLSPTSSIDKSYVGSDDCPNCVQANFSARVAMTEQNTRRIMLEGNPDTVVALENCEIFKLSANHQVRASFGDICFDDSVEINGQQQQNGLVLAHRIRIMTSNSGNGYDLAFRDSIATIDYTAPSFTVYGRTETILVDGNTVIWGTINGPKNQTLGDQEPYNYEYQEQFRKDRDTVFAFSDLQQGDVLEIKALIVDESTLLAVSIKLANCNQKECISFTTELTGIDVENRLLTFLDSDWQGWVCPNAQLTAADGAELLLQDFSVGDQVFVKGFPFEDGLFRVCVLTLISPA